jgi:hypothetical protein
MSVRPVGSDIRRLLSASAATIGPDELRTRRDTLPSPVRRYLEYALTDAAPMHDAHLWHRGTFRTAPGKNWLPIDGEQYFSVAAPGFIWNASVRPAPLVWIAARDSLVDGRGNMRVKLLSIVTIADASGPQIDQGARLRWLAESAWFPFAFAAPCVEWKPIDDSRAEARLIGDGLPVSAELTVDGEGRLTRLRAQRYRDVGGGRAVVTPWTGAYRQYREFHGVRIPTEVEVTWELDGGPFSYARFEVTSLEYNIARGG